MLPFTEQRTASKVAGGVIPISAVIGSNASQKHSQRTQHSMKPAIARTKVVIRRLPPGLTRSEFEQALGEEWTTGGGKIDWLSFREGKISKEPSRPSKPSRAYLHIIDQSDIDLLNDKVRTTSFADLQNTFHDPILLGSPCLEYSPYGRVPSSKRRNDARQGFLDQDPEFIEFLESLTNPIPWTNTVDISSEKPDKTGEIFVTPLIQHLRDKKATKDKMPGGKGSRHARVHSKNDLSESKHENSRTKATGRETMDPQSKKTSRNVKSDKSPKTIVKGAKKDSLEAKASRPDMINKVVDVEDNSESTNKKTVHTPAAVAAQLIQRDLGLTALKTDSDRKINKSKPGGEPLVKKDEPNGASAREGSALTKSTSETSTPVFEKTTNGSGSTTELNASKRKRASLIRKQQTGHKSQGMYCSASSLNPDSGSTPKTASQGTQPLRSHTKQGGSPASYGSNTFAFLKHANPSQGVTEALIEKAMSSFGIVKSVEIDKRKGFAYVEFADVDSLRKAVAASPVAVAQSNVQVLERKEKSARQGDSANRNSGTSAMNSSASTSPRTGVNFRGASRARGLKTCNNRSINNGLASADSGPSNGTIT